MSAPARHINKRVFSRIGGRIRQGIKEERKKLALRGDAQFRMDALAVDFDGFWAVAQQTRDRFRGMSF